MLLTTLNALTEILINLYVGMSKRILSFRVYKNRNPKSYSARTNHELLTHRLCWENVTMLYTGDKELEKILKSKPEKIKSWFLNPTFE